MARPGGRSLRADVERRTFESIQASNIRGFRSNDIDFHKSELKNVLTTGQPNANFFYNDTKSEIWTNACIRLTGPQKCEGPDILTSDTTSRKIVVEEIGGKRVLVKAGSVYWLTRNATLEEIYEFIQNEMDENERDSTTGALLLRPGMALDGQGFWITVPSNDSSLAPNATSDLYYGFLKPTTDNITPDSSTASKDIPRIMNLRVHLGNKSAISSLSNQIPNYAAGAGVLVVPDSPWIRCDECEVHGDLLVQDNSTQKGIGGYVGENLGNTSGGYPSVFSMCIVNGQTDIPESGGLVGRNAGSALSSANDSVDIHATRCRVAWSVGENGENAGGLFGGGCFRTSAVVRITQCSMGPAHALRLPEFGIRSSQYRLLLEGEGCGGLIGGQAAAGKPAGASAATHASSLTIRDLDVSLIELVNGKGVGAGGIIGQEAGARSTITFERCTMDNIHLMAEGSGGYVGREWNTEGTSTATVKIQHCTALQGDTNVVQQVLTGAFIGKFSSVANGNIDIKDSTYTGEKAVRNQAATSIISFNNTWRVQPGTQDRPRQTLQNGILSGQMYAALETIDPGEDGRMWIDPNDNGVLRVSGGYRRTGTKPSTLIFKTNSGYQLAQSASLGEIMTYIADNFKKEFKSNDEKALKLAPGEVFDGQGYWVTIPDANFVNDQGQSDKYSGFLTSDTGSVNAGSRQAATEIPCIQNLNVYVGGDETNTSSEIPSFVDGAGMIVRPDTPWICCDNCHVRGKLHLPSSSSTKGLGGFVGARLGSYGYASAFTRCSVRGLAADIPECGGFAAHQTGSLTASPAAASHNIPLVVSDCHVNFTLGSNCAGAGGFFGADCFQTRAVVRVFRCTLGGYTIPSKQYLDDNLAETVDPMKVLAPDAGGFTGQNVAWASSTDASSDLSFRGVQIRNLEVQGASSGGLIGSGAGGRSSINLYEIQLGHDIVLSGNDAGGLLGKNWNYDGNSSPSKSDGSQLLIEETYALIKTHTGSNVGSLLGPLGNTTDGSLTLRRVTFTSPRYENIQTGLSNNETLTKVRPINSLHPAEVDAALQDAAITGSLFAHLQDTDPGVDGQVFMDKSDDNTLKVSGSGTFAGTQQANLVLKTGEGYRLTRNTTLDELVTFIRDTFPNLLKPTGQGHANENALVLEPRQVFDGNGHWVRVPSLNNSLAPAQTSESYAGILTSEVDNVTGDSKQAHTDVPVIEHLNVYLGDDDTNINDELPRFGSEAGTIVAPTTPWIHFRSCHVRGKLQVASGNAATGLGGFAGGSLGGDGFTLKCTHCTVRGTVDVPHSGGFFGRNVGSISNDIDGDGTIRRFPLSFSDCHSSMAVSSNATSAGGWMGSNACQAKCTVRISKCTVGAHAVAFDPLLGELDETAPTISDLNPFALRGTDSGGWCGSDMGSHSDAGFTNTIEIVDCTVRDTDISGQGSGGFMGARTGRGSVCAFRRCAVGHQVRLQGTQVGGYLGRQWNLQPGESSRNDASLTFDFCSALIASLPGQPSTNYDQAGSITGEFPDTTAGTILFQQVTWTRPRYVFPVHSGITETFTEVTAVTPSDTRPVDTSIRNAVLSGPLYADLIDNTDNENSDLWHEGQVYVDRHADGVLKVAGPSAGTQRGPNEEESASSSSHQQSRATGDVEEYVPFYTEGDSPVRQTVSQGYVNHKGRPNWLSTAPDKKSVVSYIRGNELLQNMRSFLSFDQWYPGSPSTLKKIEDRYQNTAAVAKGNVSLDTTTKVLGNSSLRVEGTGGDDFVDIEDRMSVVNGGDFTVAVWVRLSTSGTAQEQRFLVSSRTATTELFFLSVLSNETFQASLTNASGNSESLTSTNSFTMDTWHHVVVQRNVDNTRLRMWVDGMLEGDKTNQATFGTSLVKKGDGALGSSGTSGVQFDGYLDEFGVWRRELTDDERARLLENPLPRNILAFYNLEGNVQDSTGNGNTASQSGSNVFVPDGKQGQAFESNDSNDFLTIDSGWPTASSALNMSFSAWFYLTDVTSASRDGIVLGHTGSGSGPIEWQLVQYKQNIGIRIRDTNRGVSEREFISTSNPLRANEWVHLGWSATGSRIELYWNALLLSHIPQHDPYDKSTWVMLENHNNGDRVDLVAVYDGRTLTPVEWNMLYNGGNGLSYSEFTTNVPTPLSFPEFSESNTDNASSSSSSGVHLTYGDGFDHGKARNIGVSTLRPFTWPMTMLDHLNQNGTYYLIVTLDTNNALLSVEATPERPVYSHMEPRVPVHNQFWYPTDHRHRAWIYNGATDQWDGSPQSDAGTYRLIVGQLEVENGQLQNVRTHAYRGYYMSDGLTADTSTALVFPHNMGTRKVSSSFVAEFLPSKSNKEGYTTDDEILLHGGQNASFATHNRANGVEAVLATHGDTLGNIPKATGGPASTDPRWDEIRVYCEVFRQF
jgi:hypothetical protein